MIDSRRCARTARASGSTQTPSSSGPRWRRAPAIESPTLARSSGESWPVKSTKPAMPHIAGHLVIERLESVHNPGEREALLYSFPGCATQCSTVIRSKLEYGGNRRGQPDWIVRRGHRARLADDHGRVSHIGGDAWHGTRHRLSEHVGEALAVDRRGDEHVERRGDPRDVVSTSEQMEALPYSSPTDRRRDRLVAVIDARAAHDDVHIGVSLSDSQGGVDETNVVL